MWFLLFMRLLPAVSVAELKEVLPAPRRWRGGRTAADRELLARQETEPEEGD